MPQNHFWLCDSLTRNFPATRPVNRPRLSLEAGQGERVSAQVCVRLPGEQARKVRVLVTPGGKGIRARVRRVGYVPMWHVNTSTPVRERDGVRHLPGLCPDPLFVEDESIVGPDETTAFWISLDVSGSCRPGRSAIRVTAEVDGAKAVTLVLDLRVRPLRVGRVGNFPVTNWFYADSLLDWYKLQPWEARFWRILPAYFRNLAEHRQNTVYVPVFTPPLDGVKRPSQLLIVKQSGKDGYRFDWRYVKRWINLAKKAGIRNFEWCHLFSQWGAKHAIRVYCGHGGDGQLLWSPRTPATGTVYRGFLRSFLPALKRFIDAEKLGSRSFFHVSDEPHTESDIRNYRKARAVLTELAPWMRVMDAVSDIRFGREKLTDMPVPTIKTALDFLREGIDSWCYFCCGPRGRYLNRLLDTPLAKIRMSGWLFHHFRMKGFLHWGYNYWQKSQSSIMIDPFTEQSGTAWPGWAYGDTFVVYPGPAGPLDSIRWEVWAESLQDMALLQAAGVHPDDELLAALKSFALFPKTAAWINQARAAVFAG